MTCILSSKHLTNHFLSKMIASPYRNLTELQCLFVFVTSTLLVKPPEAEEVWTSLRMSIDLVNVSLELLPIQLFEHPEENPDLIHLPSLARIDFIKSKFEFESFSDWSKTIDLVSQEVIFEDTRQKGNYLLLCSLGTLLQTLASSYFIRVETFNL